MRRPLFPQGAYPKTLPKGQKSKNGKAAGHSKAEGYCPRIAESEDVHSFREGGKGKKEG